MSDSIQTFEGDAEKLKVFTLKQTIIIVAFAISVTFSLASVFFRFEQVEQEIKALSTKIESVDSRHDRKYDRADERLKKLEKSGSDKSK